MFLDLKPIWPMSFRKWRNLDSSKPLNALIWPIDFRAQKSLLPFIAYKAAHISIYISVLAINIYCKNDTISRDVDGETPHR